MQNSNASLEYYQASTTKDLIKFDCISIAFVTSGICGLIFILYRSWKSAMQRCKGGHTWQNEKLSFRWWKEETAIRCQNSNKALPSSLQCGITASHLQVCQRFPILPPKIALLSISKKF